jgi:peptidyl-prolyl cis-trans isomerase C
VAALAAGGPAAGGDPCLAAGEQPLQSEALVERMLGADFAAALFAAPAGAWSGPLRSSLGWHAVRVEAREEGAELPFEARRGAARDALLAERAAAALERFLGERRPRYTVRVAAAAEPPR